MQDQRISYLLDQHLSGRMTESEQQEWASILAAPEYQQAVQEEMHRRMALSGAEPHVGLSPDAPHRILSHVLSIDKTPEGYPTETFRRGRVLFLGAAFWKWSAAAAVLLVTGSVGYKMYHKPSQSLAAKTATVIKNDIAPGANRAILTLSNGSQVVLTGARNGLLGQQGNTKIIQLANGKLTYEAGNDGQAQPIAYNTITTPRGGQYQVTLPDGTKVWLNAASSLRFPAAFTGSDRTVQVTGEAYFEVAQDKAKPFIVQAGETETRVLGTSFNVMAYGDEKAVRTTLLDGAVRMDKGDLNTLLKPGEQGSFDTQAGTMSTKKVNVRATIAWKDGYYYFDRTKTEDVMRQISRWYDVDIVYQGGIPQDEIVGKIPRTAYVSEVLHVMELIGLRFKIEGRKIIVLS